MSYPSSCGTNGAVTEISMECVNDLWKSKPNACTTSFAATSKPNLYTLVGAPPNILPFSTYGLSLDTLSTRMIDTTNYPVLCNSGTYKDPSTITNSNIDLINSYNADLNGLTAQYSITYKKYIDLIKNPPANIATTAQALVRAKALNLTTPSTVNAQAVTTADRAVTDAMNAYNTDVQNREGLITYLYTKIKALADNINSIINIVSPAEQVNTLEIQKNAVNLVAKVQNMNDTFANLNAELAKPDELDGNYEVAQTKTTSSFMKYFLYMLFAIVVIVCLVMLNLSPTEGNLDKFILALGVSILVYYIYEYFKNR